MRTESRPASDRIDRQSGEGAGVDSVWSMPPWLDPALRQALGMTRSHALLAHGPAGVGQLEFGLALGRALLCQAPPEAARPCGRCDACHLAHTHVHPDFEVLLPEATRELLGWPAADSRARGDAKPSREIRIDQVRAAIAWGQQTPARGGVKVLLIHPADALNLQSASALLKTLEEPAPSLRLVLTSADPEHLLPTVRSRCQSVRLALPTADAGIAWLRGRGLAQPEALLRLAGDSPLDALALGADGMDAAWIAALPRRLACGDTAALAGRAVPRVVQLLLKLAHDLGATAVGATPRFFPPDALPVPTDMAALLAWQRELVRVARHADHPWQAPLLVEALAAGARRLWAPARPAAGASADSRSDSRAGSGSLHLPP